MDETEQKISAMPETSQTLYLKARNYFLQALEKENSVDAQSVIFLFAQKYQDTIRVLYPNEQVLFNFWSGNYNDMLKAISAYGLSGYYSLFFEWIDFRYLDVFYKTEILDFFCNHQLELYKRLGAEKLNQADADFLYLFLTFQLKSSRCQSKDVDNFKSMEAVNQYLAKYPASPYNKFLREQLSPEYVASPFGFGAWTLSGWGDYRKDYDDYFSYGGIFGFGMDLEWGRMKTYYNFFAGWGKTKKELTDKDLVWEKG
ncbi:MAG: hypothetical protein K9H16_13265 [Bacteroidales bacterium]|nr:hypothetical protein [Bacteroidales bacterium]